LKILPYSVENLADALSNEYTSSEVISSKNHFLYLKDYLGSTGIDARTIVIEENYVSKDFLHDYASYYALCFKSYPKICKRVHFFSNTFTIEELNAAIIDASNVIPDFWNNYLGFIVIKPIPITVIGYTVLKTYLSSQAFNERNFWGVREYIVHFHGNEIKLKSLAFQEQDSVLAACATTAIWSMLNKAALDFHTILKSPSQITKDADNVSSDGSRLFPNKGLNLLQICQAIFNSGLVSEVKQPDFTVRDSNDNPTAKFVSNSYLKKILNAYSPIGIPIILVIRVPNGGDHGLHAITVSGYKQIAPKPVAPQKQISWLSDNIEKIYAHDDQWGPFARVGFKGDIELITPWTVFDPKKQSTLAINIVVPIYPKIRISYEDIEVIVLGLDRIFSFLFENKNIADLVWNIKIDFSENFKKQIKHSNLDQNEKIYRLTQSLPKYLWIASCYIASHKVFEFTFDATDVKNGMIGEDFICYLPNESKPVIVEFLKTNKRILQTLFNHRASLNYYQFLINKLSV
jgi:hypothetical protein